MRVWGPLSEWTTGSTHHMYARSLWKDYKRKDVTHWETLLTHIAQWRVQSNAHRETLGFFIFSRASCCSLYERKKFLSIRTMREKLVGFLIVEQNEVRTGTHGNVFFFQVLAEKIWSAVRHRVFFKFVDGSLAYFHSTKRTTAGGD